MIRGTTPTHIFLLPFDESMIEKIRIIYRQGDVKITKENQDCQFEKNKVTVRLTQEDTLAFDDSESIKIQVRVLTPAGDAIACRAFRRKIHELIEDEVIS